MNNARSRRPVVLIVEDDFFIRMHAVEIIEESFEVLEAANAHEAMTILEGRFDIAIVFTVIQMPGEMDGLKLAAAIRGRWPPIKILATSGLVDVRKEDLPKAGVFCQNLIPPRKSSVRFAN